jgi:hypothetical protein
MQTPVAISTAYYDESVKSKIFLIDEKLLNCD